MPVPINKSRWRLVHKTSCRVLRFVLVFSVYAMTLLSLSAASSQAEAIVRYSYSVYGAHVNANSDQSVSSYLYDNIGNRIQAHDEIVSSEQYLQEVIKILRNVVGEEETVELIADIDGDGEISLAEALYALQIVGRQK
jgi:orotate phosphoribosyltransferase-like protein